MTGNLQRQHGRPARGEIIRATSLVPLDEHYGVWSVYFATYRPRRLLKIGCSKEILKRVHNVGVGLGAAMQVEAVLPGGFQTERRIHNLLGEHRFGGEWFQLCFYLETVLLEIRSTGAWSKAPWAGDEFRATP